MSEIYFPEFFEMQDGINERDQKIAELEDKNAKLQEQNRHLDEEAMLHRSNFQARDRRVHDLNSVIGELRTELSNEEWINEQSRKEIDRLNEQIKSTYARQVHYHIDREDATVGGRTYEDVILDWLNTTLGNLNQTNIEQCETEEGLRLDLENARAEARRLKELLDKREESAYTAMSEREKAEELRNELADLNADYEQLMMYYNSQRGSSRHTEDHVESLEEDLFAAREQRDNIQRKHDELVTQLEELVKENDEY